MSTRSDIDGGVVAQRVEFLVGVRVDEQLIKNLTGNEFYRSAPVP